LVRQRTSLGLSQEEAANRIGVDQGTLAKWERTEREPAGAFRGRVKRFLQDWEASDAPRGVGSNPESGDSVLTTVYPVKSFLSGPP